jgi:predicted aspartyl protease
VKLAVASIRFEDREILDIVGVFDVPRQILGLSTIELLGLYPDTTEGHLKKKEFYSMILASRSLLRNSLFAKRRMVIIR